MPLREGSGRRESQRQPTAGYDYDTFASDLNALLDYLALEEVYVPTLVVHGTEDRILPVEATAKRLPDLVGDLKLIPVDGGPHNIGWTHPDEVNKALLEFVNG